MTSACSGLDAFESTRRIVGAPDGARTKVVILGSSGNDEEFFRALHAGATGFLVKETTMPELLHAIRSVAEGHALLSPSVTRRLIEEFASQPDRHRPVPERLEELTAREREVMGLVAMGLTNGEIAARLVVSPATAKTHVSRAMLKLHARDRAQLVALAYQSRLVEPRRAAETFLGPFSSPRNPGTLELENAPCSPEHVSPRSPLPADPDRKRLRYAERRACVPPARPRRWRTLLCDARTCRTARRSDAMMTPQVTEIRRGLEPTSPDPFVRDLESRVACAIRPCSRSASMSGGAVMRAPAPGGSASA